MENFELEIELSEIPNTVETEMEVLGTMEKGLFIPFRFAPMFRGKRGRVVLKLYMQERTVVAFGQTHFIRVNYNKKGYFFIKKCGYNPFTIIGHGKRVFKNKGFLLNPNNNKESFDEAFEK